ncbi:MAG TPA: pectinesterase family protein [Rariglobus sp.]|nr:pectinesterase family protein [Rariglobus sp.]
MRFSLLLLGCTFSLTAFARPDATVAADGSGNYTSVQAAIDAAPARSASAAPWEIHIKPGTYRERVQISRILSRLLLRGDDAGTTTISFNLNANLPDPADPAKTLGTFRTSTVVIEGDDITLENLTLANTAGNIGQALALRADGDRLVFRRCRFLGWQDTVLTNKGRHFFTDCYIEGHVDFTFGGATAYFSHCHLHALANGYITAASTPETSPRGFVFADGRITAAEGVKTYLGRPWRPFAKVVFLRTEMSAAIRPKAWHNWGKPDSERTAFYAEFASTGPGATPDARVPWSHQLTAAAAAALTPQSVLGGPDHWNPEK